MVSKMTSEFIDALKTTFFTNHYEFAEINQNKLFLFFELLASVFPQEEIFTLTFIQKNAEYQEDVYLFSENFQVRVTGISKDEELNISIVQLKKSIKFINVKYLITLS